MRFRFLYLDKNGEETKVESLDELRHRVAEGEIGEDTLLYDARSREWSPARVHSAFRSVADELGSPPSEGDAESGDDPSPREMPELTAGGIELTDAVPDAVARFLERRERERREEDERRATAFDELKVVDESSRWRSDRDDDDASEGSASMPTEVDESSSADATPARADA